jgi:cytidylate kinase
MIVTIDGPAGAGKSTAAKRLAARLGYRFLDTGAMYRSVVLAAMRRGVSLDDEAAVASIANSITIEVSERRVLVDGDDVTEAIRSGQVTAALKYASENVAVRRRLVELQRKAAQGGNIVTEGRDQGTVVFPDAGCKLFLTASPVERAKRRQQDMLRRGETLALELVLDQQSERDRRDSERIVGPLLKAADAIEVNTDGLSLDEVVDRLEAHVRQAEIRCEGDRSANAFEASGEHVWPTAP